MNRRNQHVESAVPSDGPLGGNVLVTRRGGESEVRTELSSVEEHNNILRKAIERRAYSLYELDHCKDGNDQTHWFRAEQELAAQTALFCLECDAVTVRIPTEQVSPSTLVISISGRSVLIFSDSDAAMGTLDHLDRDVFCFISLPVDVEPTQATCVMESGDLRLKLPLLKADVFGLSAGVTLV
jgi:hypothetical protein